MFGRRRLAPLAVALVALQVVASVIGIEHLAVRHVVCAEHGALIDAPAAPVVDGDSDDDDSLGARGERAHVSDHEHCALAAADDDAIAPQVRPVVVAPTPLAQLRAVAPAVIPPRAIPPLSVAPKTSPPV